MATGKYDAVAQRTLAQIRRAGGPFVLHTVAGVPVYDPNTDTWSGGSVAEAPGRAVQIANDTSKLVAIGVDLTTQTVITLLVAAKGLTATPEKKRAFLWAGVEYTIEAADAVAPDGIPILWEVVGVA